MPEAETPRYIPLHRSTLSSQPQSSIPYDASISPEYTSTETCGADLLNALHKLNQLIAPGIADQTLSFVSRITNLLQPDMAIMACD